VAADPQTSSQPNWAASPQPPSPFVIISNSLALPLCDAGVTCSPTPRPALGYLNKYHLKRDDIVFTMVTKIEQSRDPLHLVPTFTGKVKVKGAILLTGL